MRRPGPVRLVVSCGVDSWMGWRGPVIAVRIWPIGDCPVPRRVAGIGDAHAESAADQVSPFIYDEVDVRI